MNDLEWNLIVVLSIFLAVLLLLYTCLKIFQVMRKRKSRHYRHMLAEGQGVVGTNGDYVMVTMPPIKPHLFARGYRYNAADYEDADGDQKIKNGDAENQSKPSGD